MKLEPYDKTKSKKKPYYFEGAGLPPTLVSFEECIHACKACVIAGEDCKWWGTNEVSTVYKLTSGGEDAKSMRQFVACGELEYRTLQLANQLITSQIEPLVWKTTKDPVELDWEGGTEAVILGNTAIYPYIINSGNRIIVRFLVSDVNEEPYDEYVNVNDAIAAAVAKESEERAKSILKYEEALPCSI